MVRYYSDDGVFEAPLNKVWTLVQAHAEHATKIHPGLVASKGTPNPDGTVKSARPIVGKLAVHG